MTRFDRYCLARLCVTFGFLALVMAVVFWAGRAVSLFDRLIADGQSVVVFLELSALSLPAVIRSAVPIAAFAAALLVAQRMRGDSETLAMQAAGASPGPPSSSASSPPRCWRSSCTRSCRSRGPASTSARRRRPRIWARGS